MPLSPWVHRHSSMFCVVPSGFWCQIQLKLERGAAFLQGKVCTSLHVFLLSHWCPCHRPFLSLAALKQTEHLHVQVGSARCQGWLLKTSFEMWRLWEELQGWGMMKGLGQCMPFGLWDMALQLAGTRSSVCSLCLPPHFHSGFSTNHSQKWLRGQTQLGRRQREDFHWGQAHSRHHKQL